MHVRMTPALWLLAILIICLGAPLQAGAAPKLTPQQAEVILKKFPQVKKELGEKSPPRKLVFDDEEPHRYVFRLVLFLPGTDGDPPRATCIGWYAVDKKTRRPYKFTPGIE